ncbi:MAG: tRNA pseudouridine(38-40) synthase TruA [Bacilli bacterium]|nr:tRNA pseudouridine(38-40) synthase TruA [Bacilli bacterium]
MRFLASIRYDGSNFYGFQKLKDKKTVQEEVEKALKKINKKKVFIKGAGRTDRKVHAYNQMVHFDLDINISPESLKKAMNSSLDKGIYVNNIKVVNNNFHSRFKVKRKIYEYKINIGEYDPILNNYTYNYNKILNIKKMKQASKYLLGYNSYDAYVCGKREHYNTAVYKIKIKKKKNIIHINFVGKNFYQYMVRNMVGSLIMVGEEKIKPICIKEMLDKKENLYNYSNAPAQGLYLLNIKY